MSDDVVVRAVDARRLTLELAGPDAQVDWRDSAPVVAFAEAWMLERIAGAWVLESAARFDVGERVTWQLTFVQTHAPRADVLLDPGPA